jgi:hypothetical protein
VFLGYSSEHKGYTCLHVPTNRLYISRDVVFDETVFPFSSLPTPVSDSAPVHSSPVLPDQFVDVAHSLILLPNHGAGTGFGVRPELLPEEPVTYPTVAPCMAPASASSSGPSTSASLPPRAPAWPAAGPGVGLLLLDAQAPSSSASTVDGPPAGPPSPRLRLRHLVRLRRPILRCPSSLTHVHRILALGL